MNYQSQEYILAILRNIKDNEFCFIGTAFFIGNDGLVASCAHNVRSSEYPLESYYCAFPESKSKLYPIENVKFEYTAPKRQKGPVCRDISIVKIEFKVQEYLIFKRKRPLVNTKHRALGLNNTRIDHPPRYFKKNENGEVDLSDIKFVEYPTKVVNRFGILSDEMGDYEKDESNVKSARRYNNIITLDGAFGQGRSGCPVMNTKNQVIGIHFGGKDSLGISFAITAKFIGKRFKKMTRNRFDRFQDREELFFS